MPNPKSEISFVVDTIEDLRYNPNINGYFAYLETLLNEGYSLAFYRIGYKERLTKITDRHHFNNFKRSFKNPQIQ